MSFKASPSPIPANGASTSTIPICVKDAGGHTVTTATDSIGLVRTATSVASPNSATALISASPTDAASGCATFTVQSTTFVGTDTYTANDNTRWAPARATGPDPLAND